MCVSVLSEPTPLPVNVINGEQQIRRNGGFVFPYKTAAFQAEISQPVYY